MAAIVGGLNLSIQELEDLDKAVENIDSTMGGNNVILRKLAMLVIKITSFEIFETLAKQAKTKLADVNLNALRRQNDLKLLISEVKSIVKKTKS